MDRRSFMTKLGAGAAGLGLSGCSGQEGSEGSPAVHTGKRIRWRLTSSFPRSLDTLYGGAEYLSERVSAMTDGQFEIRVYPAGELVPGLQVLDAVQQGTVQLGQSASYYYTGKHPALALDACVPFGLTARQQSAWLEEGEGRGLLNEVFSDFNVLSFCGGNTGVQMGGWFKRAVDDLESLKGLKMRIPGLGGDVMSRLGVAVQVIPGGEIYPALERGAIDAAEWVGPYDDEQLGLHKVARYYYYPGWWEPGPSLSFYVNQEAWAGLPSSYQAIFQTACREAAMMMQARYDARNPAAMQRILGGEIEMKPFSDDILQAAREASEALLEENASQDPSFAKVYASWKKAREASFRWFGLAELAYAKAAFHSG